MYDDVASPSTDAPRRRRAVLRAGAVALAGAAAWALTVPLVPETRHRVGPATLRAAVHLGPGATVLVAPPLGTVSARTHVPPLDIHVSLAELDIAAVRSRITRGNPADALTSDLEPALRSAARAAALTYLLSGVIVGGLTGLLVPRRSMRTALLAACGGVFAAAVTLAIAAFTFDEQGFEQPRFTGALRSAPDVIRAVERGNESIDELGSRYEALAGRLSRLLALASAPVAQPTIDTVAILHVSDIHSNPLGVEFTARLARAFNVDAVIDTGDLTSFGNSLESSVVQLVARLGVPYIFVPGNHDSAANRSAIGRLGNVSLLDGQSTEIEGVEILGWADPTFTAANELSTEEGNEIRLQEAANVATAVTQEQPDVLAVHDVRLARDALGHVGLVLAGHTHEREFQQEDGTVVLITGSAGATGLGSFLVETDVPYEAQVVYLDGGRVVAVDYVTFSGLGRESKVERRLLPSEPVPLEE